MLSVLLGILLAALDQTIVGPAMPRIIADLKGFEYYTWVVTIYLLTSTISVPIFGKLSDMYGRKWFYIGGIAIFLLGSALAGLSSDIGQLIGFRGLQGLGAGMLTAVAFAIIADLIPPAERGKWQGVFGAVFGLASVVGPSIGGFLTDNYSWHWVFYVNIPIGLIALAVLVTTFPAERRRTEKKQIDWWGAFTLTAGLTPLLLALSLGGSSNALNVPGVGLINDWGWTSPAVLTLLTIAAVFLVLFVFIESRAKEAIIPLDLFKNSIFRVSVITVFVTGIGLFGAVLYIPLFIQAIQGGTATASGNTVTPMTMAIVVSSVVTGQIISRTGKYRIIGILGMAMLTFGMFLLYTMNMNTDRWVTIGYMIVMGLGLGVAFPLYNLVVQNAFPIQRVGVVTAAVQFFRSIGSTVGVAILGTVVNNQFHQQFATEFSTRYNQLVASIPPGALPGGGGTTGTPAGGAPGGGGLPSADTFLAGLGNVNPQVLVSSEGMAGIHTQLVQQGVPGTFADQLVKLIGDALKPALFSGINEAFLIGTLVVGIGLVTTIFLKEIPLRKSNYSPAAAMAEGGAEGYEPEVEAEVEQAGRTLAAEGLPGASVLSEEEDRELVTR